jgi:hypothetical protein
MLTLILNVGLVVSCTLVWVGGVKRSCLPYVSFFQREGTGKFSKKAERQLKVGVDDQIS